MDAEKVKPIVYFYWLVRTSIRLVKLCPQNRLIKGQLNPGLPGEMTVCVHTYTHTHTSF